MNQKLIDLIPFCARKCDPRQYLRQPFSFDAFTCASDGAIAIIVERRENTIEIAPEKIKPFLINIQKAAQMRGKEIAARDIVSIDFREEKYYTRIGNSHFQDKYLRMASSLPHARVHVLDNLYPAVIIFDGGFGVLMPCIIS